MTVDPERRRAHATSFGAVVDAYERARPTYPDAMVEWMLGLGVPRVLDLGAGTGKLTRSLVARGCETLAVDPTVEMLARLRLALPAVEARVGTAEAIPLPDGCVDVVVVGQAWHWVDSARAVPEIARVLRPGGSLAIVWNVRDGDVDWVARLDRLVDRDSSGPTYTGPPQVGPPFAPLQNYQTRWDYRLDEAGLIDLAASRSATIAMPSSERAALEADLRELFAEVARDGILTIPYVTYGFRASLARIPSG